MSIDAADVLAMKPNNLVRLIYEIGFVYLLVERMAL
jgi:hypothetical protein